MSRLEYTVAKDRFITAMAAECDGASTKLGQETYAAARALLDEVKHIQGQRAYDNTLLVIIEGKDTEISILRRRIDKAVQHIRTHDMPAATMPYCPMVLDILEGKADA